MILPQLHLSLDNAANSLTGTSFQLTNMPNTDSPWLKQLWLKWIDIEYSGGVPTVVYLSIIGNESVRNNTVCQVGSYVKGYPLPLTGGQTKVCKEFKSWLAETVVYDSEQLATNTLTVQILDASNNPIQFDKCILGFTYSW